MQVLVQPKSKHCRRCDKCVAGFDHHCAFLNNCIGSRNYRCFLSLLCSAIAAAATHAGAAIYLLARSFTAAAGTRGALARSYSGGIGLAAFRAVAGASAVLAVSVVVLVGELLAFHVYLGWHGLSTYDHIINRRAAQEVRSTAAAAAAAERKLLGPGAESGASDGAGPHGSGEAGHMGCSSSRRRRTLWRWLAVLRCRPARIEPFPAAVDVGWTPSCASDEAHLLATTGSRLIRVLPATANIHTEAGDAV